jgi:hypothetical protein
VNRSFAAGILWLAIALVNATATLADPLPRVAIWSPEPTEKNGLVQIDPGVCAAAADALKQNGIPATRLTVAELNDASRFSSATFDALMLEGNLIPAECQPALKNFADGGGVIVALAAPAPFFLSVAKDAQGSWQLSPPKPEYAWERRDFMGFLGIHLDYPQGESDMGIGHSPTRLLLKYLPGAAEISGTLPSRWVRPDGNAEFYPLLRSHRSDLHDAMPSLYLVRKDKRFTIVSTSAVLTAGADPKLWPRSAATVVALARLAVDLRQGNVTLTPDMQAEMPAGNASQLPLQSRFVRGSVEPENAQPLARWGKFDGSCDEFGPALGAGLRKSIAAGAASAEFPRALEAGAAVSLALPPEVNGQRQPIFLRIRGAYTASGAGLKASWGAAVVHNETFIYLAGPDAGRDNGVPTEFTRIIFLPPASSPVQTLTIENPGQAPVYFDAVQVERRTRPAPDTVISLNAGSHPRALPEDLAQTWGPLRDSLRTNLVGEPSDPNWMKTVYEIADNVRDLNPRLHLIAEGTPPWAAISLERYNEALSAKRPQTVPPDTQKYETIITEIAQHYRGQVDFWEIWNEPDIQQFWRGSTDEYVAFFKKIAPLLKSIDPASRILSCMSGYNEQFLSKMIDGGALKDADLFAFHPYIKKSASWDLALSRVEGYLFSRGINLEIFSDESGFPYHNAEWFTPPPACTPLTQRDSLDVAIARSLSNGLAKLSIFNAGGDDGPYGIFDGKGQPRPAYSVFADYVPLGWGHARRLDVSMTAADGSPLRGVYVAASTREDGGATIVINPAEYDPLRPIPNPSTDFSSGAGWVTFFGKTQFKNHRATVTADAGKTAGFLTTGALDADATPNLEVSVPEAAGTWSLYLKLPGNQTLTVAENQGAGIFRADLRALPAKIKARDVEISFRVTGSVVFDGIRFAPADASAAAAPKKALPILLRVPLVRARPMTAMIRADGQTSPVKAATQEKDGVAWAELQVDLTARSVVTLN